MCCAILPVLHICGDWGHSAGSDGLWLLCGHLWPPVLHGHHVPESVCGAGVLLLLQWCCMFSDSLVFSSSDPILQIKCDQPFLLWSPPSLVSCLLWCHCDSVGAVHCGHFQWGFHHCGHPQVLLVYSHHHPEDALCGQKVQSSFHLCFPPRCHHCLSWNNPFHLLPAPLWQQHGYWQSGHSVLHCSDPHAEPPDL